MKKVEAIIKPSRFEQVKDAIARAGVHALTISDVRGFGRQKGKTEPYRGTRYVVEFLPKVKLEIVLDDAKAFQVAEVISRAARTGTVGDGRVFVLSVDEVIQIRTGERGRNAV